jgi:hypothetical protein
MRITKLLTLTLVCLGVVVFFGCEGPEGPAGPAGEAGPAGADGADAQVTCLTCHNTETLVDNQIEMSRSQHAIGDLAVAYAGGRAACAPCHSGSQFIEWATTGTVAGDFPNPEPWTCNTCHGLHKTFEETFGEDMDFALRTIEPVVAGFDATVTMDLEGSSNLCMNCHQSRRGILGYWDGTSATVNVTNSHVGPHHGPQANLLFGNNGGTSTGEPFEPHFEAGCVGCHMYETTGEDEKDLNGGHTFWAAAEKCNACHTGPDVVFEGRSSDDGFEHEPYYDYKGFQTEVADKLEELGDLLVTTGILDSTHTLQTGSFSADAFKAFWNWVYIEEDRSHGVHNPYYTMDLLDEAIDLVD